jgi:hypothetical protein
VFWSVVSKASPVSVKPPTDGSAVVVDDVSPTM